MRKTLGAVIVLVVLCLAALMAAASWPGAPLRRDHGSIVSSEPDAGAPLPAALGQFTPLDPPRPAPDLSLTGRDGKALRLADFRGRFLLVNLWATWCAPCVREMPSLDRLQGLEGDRLSVLAISEDRGAGHVVEPFLAKLGLQRLAVYLDPKAAAQEAFDVRGLPTSFLIDRDGRILASLEGGADWDAPGMVAKLERYLREDENSGRPIKASAEQ
ncbi:MAG TPA: TlpA disulfide reductase family protein [Stellaceae bacterium]|nr:TlpA disulfide reductase family protein [Stellaceae bacterium]